MTRTRYKYNVFMYAGKQYIDIIDRTDINMIMWRKTVIFKNTDILKRAR